MRVALDTNILAYAEGVGDAPRCRKARKLVAEVSDAVLPAQVLGELYRVLTGKVGMDGAEAMRAALSWADSFPVVDSTWSAMQSAFDLVGAHQLQIWDALILSVAAEHRCRRLYSEDMQHGFVWRGVTVFNPFVP